MRGFAIVDGQPGAGKTTFVCRLLESNRSRALQVSRLISKPGSGEWTEEWAVPADKRREHAELIAWERSGAFVPSLLTFDPEKRDFGSFVWHTETIQGECGEFIFEGENDGSIRADCAVYVLRPLPEGASLTQETEKIVAHIPFHKYLRHMGFDIPDDEPITIEDASSAGPESEESEDKLLEEGWVPLEDDEAERLRALVTDGVPVPMKVHELHPDCARLQRANVIVINLHDASEHVLAERTRAQILDAHKDWDTRHKLGFRWGPAPGVYIADLRNPRDPVLKKALAQMKRKLRGR